MNEKNIRNIIIAILFCTNVLFGVAWLRSTNRINDIRRELSGVRTELSAAESTNRELGDRLDEANNRLEQCKVLAADIGSTTDRNITTIRQCIETVEEIRYYTACISYYASGYTSDDIYNRVDSWLKDEGVTIGE